MQRNLATARDAFVASMKRETTGPELGGVAINVQLSSSPFTLMMRPDGRLTGPQTVRVDGRAVVGTDGSGALTYVPRSASCPVGTLSPAAPSQ